MIRIAVASLFAIVLTFTPALAEPELDFDGDGVSDVLYISANGSTMRWRTVPSTGSATAIDREFGLATDVPVPANWLDADTASLAVVRLDSKNKVLVWKLLRPDGTVVERTFGRSGDYIISGGDFDGNGIADAALMRMGAKSYTWTIGYDLFVNEALSTKRFKFGKIGDRVFYLSPDGTNDWLGVLGLNSKKRKALMTLRDPSSKATEKILLPKKIATGERPRPIPVHLSSESDGFLISSQDETETKVTTYDLSGTVVGERAIPGLFNPAVARYDQSLESDNYALATASRLSLFDPLTSTIAERTPVAGTVLDSFKVQQVPVPTVAPTIAPTATPSPTPTAK